MHVHMFTLEMVSVRFTNGDDSVSCGVGLTYYVSTDVVKLFGT